MSGPGSSPVGVLVMAHGTPSTPEEIGPVLHGDPPWTAAHRRAVGRTPGRYGAIGGTSPLRERTAATGRGAGRRARSRRNPAGSASEFGAKHTAPSIEDAVAALATDRVAEIVGLVLTPHQSNAGSGEYFERASRAAEEAAPPLTFVPVPSWHRADGIAALLAARTATAIDALDEKARVSAWRSCSPRTASRCGRWPTTIRTRCKWPSRPRTSPTCSASATNCLRRGAWPGRARVVRPTRGSDPTCSPRSGVPPRTGPPRWWSARWASCPTTSRSSTTSTSRRPARRRDAGIAFARTESLNDDPRLPRRPGRRGARRGGPTVSTAAGPTFVVVGAGIAGLAAAWELVREPGPDGAPVGRAASTRRHESGKAPRRRVRRPDRRPRRRRVPRAATRGDRVVRRARHHRRAGAARRVRCVDLGTGPVASDARGFDPRGADQVVAAGAFGGTRAPQSRCGWHATW